MFFRKYVTCACNGLCLLYKESITIRAVGENKHKTFFLLEKTFEEFKLVFLYSVSKTNSLFNINTLP